MRYRRNSVSTTMMHRWRRLAGMTFSIEWPTRTTGGLSTSTPQVRVRHKIRFSLGSLLCDVNSQSDPIRRAQDVVIVMSLCRRGANLVSNWPEASESAPSTATSSGTYVDKWEFRNIRRLFSSRGNAFPNLDARGHLQCIFSLYGDYPLTFFLLGRAGRENGSATMAPELSTSSVVLSSIMLRPPRPQTQTR